MADEKEFKYFDKEISNILSTSKGASNWTDLLTFTKKIHEILSKKENDFNFNLITDKVILSKRLAQCLHPECPKGVHRVVIDIYDILFKNILEKNDGKLGENLSIFSSGIFPFFSYASLENKIEALKNIFQAHYLKLEQNELTLCLSGLLSSLIPGLDDNNEDLTKEIYKTLDDIKTKVKPGVFYGTFWSLLLRNRLLRPSAILYLNEKVISFKDYQILDEEKKEKVLNDEFPNVNTLIVNCLLESINEKETATIRNTMDFIMTRLPLSKENTIISDESKINLIQGTLRFLIKNDYSLIKRLYFWIVGANPTEEEVKYDTPDMIYKMGLVVSALKKVFNSEKKINSEDLKNYVTIISKLFSEQINFVDFMLPQISYDLILIFVEFWLTELNSSENAINEETIKCLRKFFKDKDNYVYLWKSMLNYLEKIQERKDLNFESTEKQDVKNIEELILKIVQQLKFCFLFFNLLSAEERIKYFIPIINNLIKITLKFSIKEQEELPKIRHIITTTLAFIKGLQEKQTNKNKKELKTLNSYEVNKNEVQINYLLFDKLNYEEENFIEDKENLIRQTFNLREEMSLKNILGDKNNIKMMEDFNKTIINYQEFYIKLLGIFDSIEDQYNISKEEISYFSKITEIMIRLQEYIQSEDIPEWYNLLEKIIFKDRKNPRLSLEASKYLLDFNLSYFQENEIYKKIKADFLEKEVDDSLINKEEYNKELIKLGVKKTYYELLLGKLYIQVSEQFDQELIIDLLLKLYEFDNDKFVKFLENTFTIKEYLENNVKLFADFWQYFNEYYTDLNIFPNGECILQMLDFFDSDNPLIKHLSKYFLDQSTKSYKKIIDPLLKGFLAENFEIEILNTIYQFKKEYNASKVLTFFIRLKNLIANTDMMDFLIENSPEDDIKNVFNNKPLFNKFKKENEEIELNYFMIITSITLLFTSIQYNSEFNENSKNITLSINTSCCELLEILFNQIKKSETINPYTKEINFSLLLTLDRELTCKNKNYLMQIQILSVLKALYHKTSWTHPNFRDDALSIFRSYSFQNCLLKGMSDNFYFIKESYINFTNECLPFFKTIISDEKGKNIFYSMGGRFIKTLVIHLSHKIKFNKNGRKDNEKFSHFNQKNDENCLVFKNYLDEYKDYKYFDEVDVLLALKAVKNITFNFLNINPKDPDSIDWKKFKDEINESFRPKRGIFSFLFPSSSEISKNFLQGDDEKLFNEQIKDLLICLLLIWTNESYKYEYYDYCLNNNGILPFKKVDNKIFSKEDIIKGFDSIQKDPIKNIIKEISLNLFLASPINFMQNIVKIWCNEPKDMSYIFEITMDSQYKLTIIEYLISLRIPINFVIFCLEFILSKNSNSEKYIYNKETREYIMPYEEGVYEAKIIHFLYSYISLNPTEEIDKVKYSIELTRNSLNEAWLEMINFLTTLVKDTKIIYTYCWIYELLEMTIAKLTIPIGLDFNAKDQLIDLFIIITEKLENCALYDKTDCTNINDDKLILPYLPNIYLSVINSQFPEYISYLYNRNKSIQSQNIKKEKEKSQLSDSKIEEFFKTYYSCAKIYSEKIDNNKPLVKKEDLKTIYRKIACITFMRIFYKIGYFIYYYNQEECKKQVAKLIEKLFEFLKNNNSEENIENKDYFYDEFASKFLSILMYSTPNVVAFFGKEMFINYLQKPYFFRTTPSILRNFRYFISVLVDKYPGILLELFSNINSKFFDFLGSGRDKVKILRRISFVIYSCEKDKFKNDFEKIREKAKFFLTSHKSNFKLEQEIFLMMRILFLRFSHDGVMKMIKELWPIIFTEIIQNLKNENRNKELDLIIENFKFIELLSLANPEEFCLYQWIFLIDTFSMKDLDIKDPKSLLSELLQKENKIFKPVALDFLDKNNLEIDNNIMEGKHKGKSTLIFRPENATLEEMQKALKNLFYSIGDMNNYKIELDLDQVEKLIEEDFIDKDKENDEDN